jgi:hypothetical protein
MECLDGINSFDARIMVLKNHLHDAASGVTFPFHFQILKKFETLSILHAR